MTEKVLQEKIQDIVSIHGKLSSARSLAPSRMVNTNFSKLVGMVNTTLTESSMEILGDKKITAIQGNLRRLSLEGESELERFWAERILGSNCPQATMTEFPYFKNYEIMTDFEVEGMKSCDLHEKHKVLFAGSGSLPLSSIMMAEKHGFNVDNLDIDKKACTISRNIIKSLNLSNKVRVINKNIFDITNFSTYNAIFVAAHVGKDEAEKIEVIEHIAKYGEKGTHIILRSVTNLGVLLYPEINIDHLRNIEVLRKYDRPKGVINNIIVGKIK